MKTMSEFRKHGRRPVRYSIQLSHGELGDIFAETKDISETGVFVAHRDLAHRMAVGEKIEAKLSGEDTDEDSDVCLGLLKVIRLTREGVGLEYVL